MIFPPMNPLRSLLASAALLLPSAVMILAGLGAVALLTLDNWFSFLAFAFCPG